MAGKRKLPQGGSGANARQKLSAWRGFSPGEYGTNLQFGVANPPPGGLGPTNVTGLPPGRLPGANMIRRAIPANIPGTTSNGVPGMVQDIASGNPDVSTVQRQIVDTPFGRPRPLGVGQETTWRGGAFFANDKLMTMDRHAFLARGNELSGRNSGNTDPPMDGPARPSLRLVNRTINYQQGTDTTAAQDDLSRNYLRTPDGRWFMGTRGDSWNQVYGGTPGMWQPYGTYAGIGNVPVQGIQSPVSEGSAGDGPQSFRPGPPSGLHSPTLPDYAQTLGYYMAVPQMRAPRIDRPSNSTIGGQSYSQTVIPQGQTGTIAQSSTVGAGVNWQTRKRAGWRGQSGAGNGNQ